MVGWDERSCSARSLIRHEPLSLILARMRAAAKDTRIRLGFGTQRTIRPAVVIRSSPNWERSSSAMREAYCRLIKPDPGGGSMDASTQAIPAVWEVQERR